ncbi:MAG: SUMF1/EgtB/PvdO family nonheme iron enzyme [Alphaproteobacteria bacterium]
MPETVAITAGPFIAGSDAAEREAAYVLDEAAYGHNRTRKFGWYDRERKRASHDLPAFEITRTPITNSQYAAFVAETGHPAPDVDEATWKGYRLIHPFARTRRHAWRDGAPPDGRAAYPVVMADATAYDAWLSVKTGQTWRLPSELEWGEIRSRRARNALSMGRQVRPCPPQQP